MSLDLGIYEWSSDDAFLNTCLQWVMGRCQRLIRQRQARGLLPTGRAVQPADVIFPDEIDDLLSGERAEREHGPAPQPDPDDPRESRLQAVRDRLGLSGDAFDLLVLAIAPDIAPEIARLYAFIQGSAQRYALSLSLAADLLDRGLWQAHGQRRLLEPSSTLVRYDLVRRLDDGNLASQCSVVPNPDLYDFLQGLGSLPRELARFAEVVEPLADPDLLLTERDERLLSRIEAELQRATDAPGAAPRPAGTLPTVMLHGAPGTGKRTLAGRLAARCKRTLLIVDTDRWPPEGAATHQLQALQREALLRGAWLCFTGGTLIRDARDSFDALVARLDAHPDVWMLSLPLDQRPALPPGRARLVVPTRMPVGQVAMDLWRRALAGLTLDPELDLDALAHQYPLAAGDMQSVATLARTEQTLRDASIVDLGLLVTSIHQRIETRLQALAVRLDRVYSMDQLVAPDQVISELQTMIARGRHARTIFERWGFGRGERKTRGFSALFSGPSGTGKTMAAMIVARELELDVYRVDLASVVSKYIGETEKNLEKVFAEAERANIVILFDEADSLFAKRTRVKSSHDRYANMEVNYLLQRLDSFTGIAILTSNFGVDMDDALARRLDYRIEFPFPKPEHRAILWQALLPTEARRADDIDFQQLADAFEIAGGHIRNALLRAAFMAAARNQPITQDILLEAGYLEMRSMGHLVAEAEFIRERMQPTRA